MDSQEKKTRSMAEIARSVSQLEDAPTEEEIRTAAEEPEETPEGWSGQEEARPEGDGDGGTAKGPRGVDKLIKEEAYVQPAEGFSGEEQEKETPETPFDPDAVPGVRFSIEPHTRTTFQFLVRHSFSRVSGWFVLAVGIIMILLPFVSGQAAMASQKTFYVILGVGMLVLPFFMMYRSAVKQEKRLAGKPVLYIINEEGLTSVMGDNHGSMSWKDVYRFRELKESFILYMDKGHAVVWPKEQMGQEAVEQVRAMAQKAMEAGKCRLLEKAS